VAERHPKKEIQSAIEYAFEQGWHFTKAGARAHIYGTLYCSHEGREGCLIGVFSTPRNPSNHASHIRRRVNRCPHAN
jgi:hypothetical protein